jgi:putative tryptophan/tyrosine transport system substrate-binding protein
VTISRRQFVLGTGVSSLGLLAGCGRLPGQAAPPVRLPRIGYLAGLTPAAGHPNVEGFRQGLREHGYLEGENIIVEYRWADGQRERLPALATELARLPVDVIMAARDVTAVAAKQATNTVPIVFAGVDDPVGLELVASLGRPGGNVTGVTSGVALQLEGKRLELLTTTVPGASRVAVLWSPAGTGAADRWREIEAAARVLDVQLRSVEIGAPGDLATAFEAATREQADALLVERVLLTVAYRTEIAKLALYRKLPAIFDSREAVEAGGLMAYGPSLPAGYRRAAYFVDRILKGAKPADLPVEQPMTFDFVVNLKTAQTLGITFPNEIMLQVTEVIQ